MESIMRLQDIDVVLSYVKQDPQDIPELRVELIDKRVAEEIVTLTPAEAHALGVILLAKLAPHGGGWDAGSMPATPGGSQT